MNQSLIAHFDSLSDEALLARVHGGLTDEAWVIARAELDRRGIPVPEVAAAPSDGAEPYRGDMVILEQNLTPTEAHLLCGCLESAGIRSDAGDTNFVQAYSLLSTAVGGAKVRVPSDDLPEARDVLSAFRRGDFALGDDFDVGGSGA